MAEFHEVIAMHYRQEELPFVKKMRKVIDDLDQCPVYLTEFLTLREQQIVQSLLAKTFFHQMVYGGHTKAERCRILLSADDLRTEPTLSTHEIACLDVSIKKGAVPLRHADYLGAILGLGMKREVIGDIRLTENGAFVFCSTRIVDFLLREWHQAGRNAITLALLDDVDESLFKQPAIKEMTVTVKSLRLDAVVGHAFSMSRTKATEPIRAGLISVNHVTTTDVTTEIALGDIIRFRGNGRATVIAIGAKSKKDRIFLTIGRYQ